jgi:lipoprotein-anchoring transpeptidase ErfK/SrfK
MRISRPRSRVTWAALAAGVVAVVIAVIAGAAVVINSSSSKHDGVRTADQPVPRARLHVVALHNGRVPYAKHLQLRVKNGAINSVQIHVAGAGAVAGTLNSTHTRWRSTAVLVPSTDLRGAVSYVTLDHRTVTHPISVQTPAARKHLTAVLSPGAGDTVGIASPVVVSFDRPVPTSKRAAVEHALSVTAQPAVVGAWHWMTDQEVHWRPPSYWKPGTHVTIRSDLQGLDFGDGVWGAVGHHQTSFVIGAAHVSEVNVGAHVMHVYDNGRLIKTFPISAGRAQYPTASGVHIALEKSPVVQMNSATVGIPQGSPGAYNETVYWDVRISYAGAFVHAAPWSLADQGNTNVSHGCVNISPANAKWFYYWSYRGDVIDVYNAPRPPSATDPGTADWNMSWKAWLAGDAAPTAAAKALHPRLPRTYEPGFAPPPKQHHHKHRSAARHAKHASRHQGSGSSVNYSG